MRKFIGVIDLIKSIEDRSEKIQENIKQKSQNLFKDNLKLGLTSISNLIEIFSKFEDEFGEIAHKGFSLAYDLYEHYTLIYKSNMERLENTSNSTIANTLDPINEKINHLIDFVNSNDKNLKISKDLKFDESGMPYKNQKILSFKNLSSSIHK
ncbi:hemolysin accessory protein (plasmid) [Borreliella burgdorferi 29805]|nr:hemolysin accessory protein [Borreliella burgdorferi 29805]